MSEATKHVSDSIQFIGEHWAQLSFATGAAAGIVVWLFNQALSKYATVQAVREFDRSNREQHEQIIEKLNNDKSEILKTILTLQANEKK
jgi:hypothetical protein